MDGRYYPQGSVPSKTAALLACTSESGEQSKLQINN